MINTLGRYFRTIRHLKPRQIGYRLWYAVRGLGSAAGPKLSLPDEVAGSETGSKTGRKMPHGSREAHQGGGAFPRGGGLTLEEGLRPRSITLELPGGEARGQSGGPTFTFLNRSHTFREGMDWEFDKYGILWSYNLNYHDFLRQPGLSAGEGLALMRDYIDKLPSLRTGLQPYPTSLRGANWIFFITRHSIDDPRVDAALYAQYRLLSRSPEYHIMGNHLLENACSLLFGAYYFREETWLEQAEEILTEQVSEQVLADGGHFERSTMYHAILLERLLDCHNLLSRNPERFGEGRTDRLARQVKNACSRMMGWMEQVWMSGGRMPLLNDAARDVAPSRRALRDYAARLGVSTDKRPLSDSGYRRHRAGELDLLADVGDIGPDYIPGHAHADTLSFVLDVGGEPVIIDPGVSTYEDSEARQRERSTAFHNTVTVDREDQSEVWSAFRVGRRAKVIELEEEAGEEAGGEGEGSTKPWVLSAAHDGYRRLGVTHRRRWELEAGQLTIRDELDYVQAKTSRAGRGEGDAPPVRAYLHFAPGLEPVHVGGNGGRTLRVELPGERPRELPGEGPGKEPSERSMLELEFKNARSVELEKYSCPDGYNQYLQAVKAVVTFSNRLVTRISPSE